MNSPGLDLEEILATSAVVLYRTDIEGDSLVPVWVSRNVAQILGYTVDQALATGWWWERVHPEDRDAASRSLGMLRRQKQHSHEYRFRHANGAYVWMLDQMRLVKQRGETAVIGSWTDISTARQQQERLAAAEAHYRRLIQASPYSVFTLDETGALTEVNEAGERILGRTSMVGMNFTEYVAPEDLPIAQQVFGAVISGTEPGGDLELRIRRPDGAERLLSLAIAPIIDDGIVGVHGIARDITDERRVAQERERVRAQYERLITTSPDAIYALDLKGRFTEVSRATGRLLGRSVDELIGSPFMDIIAPADRGLVAAAYQRRVAGSQEISELDVRVVRSDGELRLVHIRAAAIVDGDVVIGSQGIARDITAERARDEHMRLLTAALDQLPDGVCITRGDDFVYANAAFFRLLGRDPNTDSPLELLVETVRDTDTMAAMRTALEEQGAWRGTFPVTRDVGEPVPIEMVSRLVVVDDDTLSFSVLRDLTDEVAREQQLRTAERLASLGTLVAGVAHELNNPLTAIGGFAELMLMEPQSDENREMLQLTMREATRAAKIVADLRLIARETQHTAPTTRGPVDLNDVIQHVLKLQRYTLETSNVRIDVDLAADAASVLGNASELEQVVLNLIVNARQAMDARNTERSVLSVRTRATPDGILLRVADNGPGIPRDHLERVFDPFFTTKSPGEGMGLGLSLVHRIVTEHGGTVRVESSPGTGAAFIILLPPSAESAAAPPDEASSRQSQGLRLLVVDDEQPIRRALMRYLGRHGHTVDTAKDGNEALQLIAAGSYDVVLSDLRMPGMGGEELLDTLRERHPDIAARVMFMTGHVARDDEAFRRTYGDVPIIDKPFSLDELGRRIDDLATRLRTEGD